MKKSLSLFILFGILCFYVHAQTTYNLDGTWIGDGIGGSKNSWMYVFTGSEFTMLANNDSTYVERYKGYFKIEKAQFVIDTYEYTQKVTHAWRNGSWELIIFSTIDEKWYITGETNNRFTIRDSLFTTGASWNHTYTKQ
jgi:hypothetical protein